jgi:hypothetical protein
VDSNTNLGKKVAKWSIWEADFKEKGMPASSALGFAFWIL